VNEEALANWVVGWGEGVGGAPNKENKDFIGVCIKGEISIFGDFAKLRQLLSVSSFFSVCLSARNSSAHT